MSDIPLLISYVLAAWLSILTPGPAILLAMRNGARQGVVASLWSTLGNMLGLLVVSAAAAWGVGLFLLASAHAMTALRLAGAAYLAYLGLRLLVQGRHTGPPDAGAHDAGPVQAFALAKEGFLVATSNPKSILFFTAFFPQFIRADQALIPQFMGLTAIFVILSGATLTGYAAIASRVRGELGTSVWRQRCTRLAGIGFLGFAAWILLSRPSSGAQALAA